MMERYAWYIATYIVSATIIITISLSSIVWLTQALRLVEVIVSNGAPVGIFLQLAVLILPSLLLIVLPISLFIAVVFTYNKLQGDSELVVMRASGLSPMMLAKPAILVAAGASMVGYFISLYLLPLSYTKFHDMQHYLRNHYVSVLLEEGVFSTPVKGLTVFIRERDDSGLLRGILVHDSRSDGMAVTMMAEEGKMQQSDAGQRFLMKNGNRQEMNEEGKLSLLYFDEYALDIGLYTNTLSGRTRDPQELFLHELFADNYNTSLSIKYQSEAHQRLSWPLYAMTFTLIALLFMLTGEYNRRGSIKQLLVAIALVGVLTGVSISLRNSAATHVAYIVAVYANAIVPAVIVLLMLQKNMSVWIPTIALPRRRRKV